MNKLILITLSVATILILAACSARTGAVQNVPPVIRGADVQAMKFGVEYGVMKPEVISVLVWPTNWTEKETENRVYTINKNSQFFDALIVEKLELPFKIAALYGQFTAQQCIAKFQAPAAEGEVVRDPATYAETDDVTWTDAGTVTAEEHPAFDGCVKNQVVRREMHRRDDQIISGTPADATLLQQCPSDYGPQSEVELTSASRVKTLPGVSTLIDCALGADNKVAVSKEGSSLKITPAADGKGRVVDISFGNFNGAGERVSQSTMKARDLEKFGAAAVGAAGLMKELSALAPAQLQERLAANEDANIETLKKYAKSIVRASIDSAGRRLKFMVPDMQSEFRVVKTEAGLALGYSKMYAFDLSRVDNLMDTRTETEADGSVTSTDFAKFKGDLALVVDGVIARYGSGQLMGPFVSTAPAR